MLPVLCISAEIHAKLAFNDAILTQEERELCALALGKAATIRTILNNNVPRFHNDAKMKDVARLFFNLQLSVAGQGFEQDNGTDQ